MDAPVALFAFLGVGAIALFSFLAVASWSDSRRKEREAYYKSEALKKIAETQGGGGNTALEYLREEEKIAMRRQREGQKVGGMITAAVGIGLMVMLAAIADKGDKWVSMVGAIPLLIGVALLIYAYLLAPKE